MINCACDCVIAVPVMLDEAMDYLEKRPVSKKPHTGGVNSVLIIVF